MNEKQYTVLGMMSGTSLDGLDLALSHFSLADGRWTFEIARASTVDYPAEWQQRLSTAMHSSAEALCALDFELGKFMGEQAKAFLGTEEIDFAASHGHTVFHDPAKGYTLQIGRPESIAAVLKGPVLGDFRSLDVALGGQGAPLVPIGDRLLFAEYQACLNLGGIANISFEESDVRKAFDICPINMGLNVAVRPLGKAYDAEGALASEGSVDASLLVALNALDFYQQSAPKSLGKEWFDAVFWPLVEAAQLPPKDTLATLSQHAAEQIGSAVQGLKGKMLVTGGGAFNTDFMQRLSGCCGMEVVLPSREIIAFKEALIFAFLGVLRWRGESNVLRSVTGSRNDHSGGSVYHPFA